MLELSRSNRVESLLELMAAQFSHRPLSSPFVAETVVIPSPAMARWTRLQLARKHGVAAHYHCLQPASFVWQLAVEQLSDLPDSDPLEREALAWKIFGLLPSMLAESSFETLKHYLQQDEHGVKRLQLAQRIADVFDRYQFYRPDLIRQWDSGSAGDADADWQAPLWRRINRDLQEQGLQNRVAVMQLLIQRLSGKTVSNLPERISVFAVSSLPPLFIQVFLALAQHSELSFYLHSPTDQFWADLVSQKELARLRLERPGEAELWEVANPLLASWGRQGQALQDLLLEHDPAMAEVDVFVPPGRTSLLDRLQMDLFELKGALATESREHVASDDSVQLHICHSPQRECQVLHDRLLAMFDSSGKDSLAGLRPEDILVMVPEISAYAPYIESVFGRAPVDGRPFIPWNLSDTSIRDEHPLVQGFLQLLELPSSRFSRTEILSYLDVPELARRFGLDSRALTTVRGWTELAGLRWGLDGAHKSRLGLPETEQNSWAQLEKRLFGGYALDDDVLFGDIAPLPGVDGASGEILGRFWRLLSTLQDYSLLLARARTAWGWQKFLGRMLSDFFGERNDEDNRLQKIRDVLADLATQAGAVEDPLSIELVKQWLAEQLITESRHGRYFSGGVTFCGMRPMRSLPFRVICLVGMNDAAFPRRNQYIEFDLMRQHWRPGDPRKNDEDRYLFLETLLCARHRLYISYTGRDIQKNTERQPSVLVRELLDYINQRYHIEGSAGKAASSGELSRIHPLQAFSPRNYEGEGRSFDPYWCSVAEAIGAPAPPAAGLGTSSWSDLGLSPAPDSLRQVSLAQLLRFVRHPVRYFVQARLGLYLQEEAPGEDDEIFEFDGLQSYLLKKRLLEDALDGIGTSAGHLAAEGALPHGPMAQITWEKTTAGLNRVFERIAPFEPVRAQAQLIRLEFADIAGGGIGLSGQIRRFYPDLGLLHYGPGKLKGQDLLAMWIEHLACRAMGIAGYPAGFVHTPHESFEVSGEISQMEARDQLSKYLAHYWQGLHRPPLILPNASYEYVNIENSGGRADPEIAASKTWQGNSYQNIPGDKDDAYIRLVRRGLDGSPLLHPDFIPLARDFYSLMLTAGRFS
jgi:exodeoxyribonuclease V gamma subunit